MARGEAVDAAVVEHATGGESSCRRFGEACAGSAEAINRLTERHGALKRPVTCGERTTHSARAQGYTVGLGPTQAPGTNMD